MSEECICKNEVKDSDNNNNNNNNNSNSDNEINNACDAPTEVKKCKAKENRMNRSLTIDISSINRNSDEKL